MVTEDIIVNDPSYEQYEWVVTDASPLIGYVGGWASPPRTRYLKGNANSLTGIVAPYSVSKIEWFGYISIGATNGPYFYVDIRINGSYLGARSFTIPLFSLAWRSVEWTGLTYSKSDIDTLYVNQYLTTINSTSSVAIVLGDAYLRVTYLSGPAQPKKTYNLDLPLQVKKIYKLSLPSDVEKIYKI